MAREIVHIDEDRCDGCGQCVPACKEGAIRIINGKARLAADNLCDGLGACLGHCPRDAIRIEKRDAADFDERAVERHLAAAAADRSGGQAEASRAHAAVAMAAAHSGCPSARFNRLGPGEACAGSARVDGTPAGDQPSELMQWPVQLRLLPATAPVLRGAHLLIAADCVPFAYADFHRRMLRGRAVVIACPKLDDPEGYVEKLANMMQASELAGVTVTHMEVPCCTGILRMAIEARRQSGVDLPIHDIVVSTRGEILAERTV